MEEIDPERKLYLAISQAAYNEIAEMKAFSRVRTRFQIALFVVALEEERIVEWIG